MTDKKPSREQIDELAEVIEDFMIAVPEDAEDWSSTDMAESILDAGYTRQPQPPQGNVAEAFKELKTLTGKYYADVDDVVGYINGLRGHPSVPPADCSR